MTMKRTFETCSIALKRRNGAALRVGKRALRSFGGNAPKQLVKGNDRPQQARAPAKRFVVGRARYDGPVIGRGAPRLVGV
jgi:hypothetical protein